MRTSIAKISNLIQGQRGFSLIEILVALLLAALVFLAVPSGESAQKHRDLKAAVDDIDRSIRFAANEAVLRNTVVRLRLSLDKSPVEYNVEYGPQGNLALPDMANEKKSQGQLSLAEEKAQLEKKAALDRQFTKVEEFDEIKHEIPHTVDLLGVGTESQKQLMINGEASMYFYPTGEKDAAIVFFATSEEIAYLDIEPFMSETKSVFEPLKSGSVAKVEDLLQTRMDEVYKEWVK